MSNNKNTVIDLTSSFTLADHYTLSDVIIDVDDSDQSFDSSTKIKRAKKKCSNVYTLTATFGKASSVSPKKRKEKSSKIGNCPICWDDLGNNSLASTKCGHVFCLVCLEEALKIEKRCPTCRRILKGKLAYHPLYLPKD